MALWLKAGVSGREPMQFACKYVQLAPCCYDNGTQLQELLGIERKENKKIYKMKYFLLQNGGEAKAPTVPPGRRDNWVSEVVKHWRDLKTFCSLQTGFLKIIILFF